MIRYAVCPGYVISKSDRQQHFISATQLMRLYNLPANECLVLDTDAYFNRATSEKLKGYTKDFLDTLQWLTPSYDGNYTRIN